MSHISKTNITASAKIEELEPLAAAMRNGRIAEISGSHPLLACLMQLLSAQEWRGDQRQILEALPHIADDLDAVDIQNILATLGQPTRCWEGKAHELDDRLLPCLFIDKDNNPYVLLRRDDKDLIAFDPHMDQEITLPPFQVEGRAFLTDASGVFIPQLSEEGIIRHMVGRFKKMIYGLFGMSFALNILSLTIPLSVMVIFDKVIGNQSLGLLSSMAIGLGGLLIFDLSLRFIRAKAMATMAGRIERLLGVATFRKLLSLPPANLETAPVSAQIARLREFETVRDLFTGPMASILLDAPFFFIFLGVIAALGGWLALIPAGLIVIYALLGLWLVPGLRRRIRAASNARSRKQALLVETVTKFRSIKEQGAEEIWAEIHRAQSAETAYSQYQQQTTTALLQTFGQGLMMLAGALTLVCGAELAMAGGMSVGALIATMALVWRVLSPIQMAFFTFPRIEQITQSLRQLNSLMKMKGERDAYVNDIPVKRNFRGDIAFNRVSMRYSSLHEPALLGVSAEIQAGQLIGITGGNGCGKSTLLKLLLGMYSAQAGAITIDGLDIRQIDPRELRLSVAYLPQYTQLFHGTIAQNLLMSEPTADMDTIKAACKEADCLAAIEMMPDGFHTRLNDALLQQLPAGFKQKLSLARLYLRDAPIVLLDEPAQGLDEEGDEALVDYLQKNKGKKTILFTSHRPSHLRMSDKMFVMKNGVIASEGTPDEVMGQQQPAPSGDRK